MHLVVLFLFLFAAGSNSKQLKKVPLLLTHPTSTPPPSSSSSLPGGGSAVSDPMASLTLNSATGSDSSCPLVVLVSRSSLHTETILSFSLAPADSRKGEAVEAGDTEKACSSATAPEWPPTKVRTTSFVSRSIHRMWAEEPTRSPPPSSSSGTRATEYSADAPSPRFLTPPGRNLDTGDLRAKLTPTWPSLETE